MGIATEVPEEKGVSAPEFGARGVAAEIWGDFGLPFLIVGAQVAIGAVGHLTGLAPIWENPADFLGYTWMLLWAAVSVLPLIAAGSLARGSSLSDFRAQYLNFVSVSAVVVTAILFSLSAVAHDAWKGMLGIATPYTWDARLAGVDRVLHFGTDPWRLTHQVFGSAVLTKLIDVVYWAWYLWLYGLFSWVAWTRNRALRVRFLTAWVLTWIVLGTVVAHSLPSGGPVFYGSLLGTPDPFSPLLDALGASSARYPLFALELQELIWRNYIEGARLNWITMSAMPSLHVGAAVIGALAVGKASPRVGWAAWAFVAAILIGSVHLGWHYAVDGYVAIMIASAIWFAVGRLEAGRSPLSLPT